MKPADKPAFSKDPSNVVWEPKPSSGTKMRAFMKKIQEKYNIPLDDYWDIYNWSIDNKDKFWAEIWEESGIIYSKPYDKVIDLTIPMHEFQDWFAGARLNFAENLLKFRDNHVAIIAAGEDKETKRYTYADVFEEVKLYAAALKKHGIRKGDVASCFMSNREEAVFAMIASVSLGAIWTGALPLMGSQAVLNRLKQVSPVILFTVDRFQHDKQEKDMLSKLKEISESLPSLKKIVIVPSKPCSKSKDISFIKNSCFLDDFLESGKNLDGSVPEMSFEQVPVTYPVCISYTSGTTGLPKGIVHSSGVGWASWNIFVQHLFLGHTFCLFEGVPYFLSPTSFWDIIDKYNISSMFLLPSVLDELEKRGYKPSKHHKLSSVVRVSCGGSKVKPQNFDFFCNNVKVDCIFTEGYGFTELMGYVAGDTQILEVHRCEVPCPELGTDLKIYDESGNSVIGKKGEVVICSIGPNLPELWNDPDRSRLKKAYYDKFPGIFCSGDMGMINPSTGGLIIFGRSDETLKQRGCRFGSSEIYNIIDRFPEVRDSLVVSQYNQKGDERAVLFLKMKAGHQFCQELILRIRDAITRELTERHVPDVIVEAKEIPYNINGKKLELLVKKIINNMPFNADSVANPESLDYFKNLQL